MITENVNAEHAKVRFDDEFVDFKLVFESLASPYVVLKPDFTIVAASNSYLDLTDTDSSIVNKSLFEVFPSEFSNPEDSGLSNLKGSLDRVLSMKAPDTVFLQKYGLFPPSTEGESFLEKHWQALNYPVLDDSGEVIYLIHHIEDFSNIIKMQNQSGGAELANLELRELKNLLDYIVEKNIELKKIRNFLELILKNIPNMVFVKDAKDLKFVSLNKAGEDLLGYKQSDLLGKNDYDFFPKEQADFFTSKDRAVLSSGEVLDIAEEPIHTRKGDRVLHTKKVPIYDEQGNGLFLVGISEDITEKVDLMEARLAQKSAEEMALKKAKFLDIAAHELRTPITSLSLLLQLALRQIEKGKPAAEDIIPRLKEPADRLKRLVIDLLDMSRLERGLVALTLEPADLNQLVFKCVEDFRIQAPGRNFIFIKEAHEIILQLDPTRINQVLSNFLDNAVKYTNDGDIEITIKDKKEFVRVSVIDHGPGIPKDQQSALFSAFSRGNSESTIKASGLGLGLSVSKGIMDLHRGRIGVESVEGQGCTFYFEIPRKDQTL